MIIKGKESQEKLLEGINCTADVVKTTLGTKGRTVLIQEKYGLGFNITKDGVTVANSISFDEEYLNIGSDFIKNAAKKTVDEAGDGTSTTSILTQSMCNNIFKELELGKNQNELIKDLKEDLEMVVNYIKDKSKKIENTEDIKNIALVSSNNDLEIANNIKDIYDNTNFNVVIDVVESENDLTNYEIVNGFTIYETGYSSRQFINNFDKGRVEYSNPRIYINNGK